LQAVLLAATYPDRVTKLIIVNGFARLRRADDYPAGVPGPLLDRFVEANIHPEDEEVAFKLKSGERADVLSVGAPSVSGDPAFRRWWDRAGRRGASPATAKALLGVAYNADVRSLLPVISAPTLVLHRRDEPVFRIGHGRYLAEHIPGAKLVELPGADTLYWVGDTELMLDEIEEFLAGHRSGAAAERVLATVLFSDIVDSTRRAASLGDREWKALLDRHDEAVQRQITQARGRLVKTTGDGCLATFDGPGRAIACAAAMRDELRAIGLDIRVGLHTGEVERRGDDIGGIAVHIGARIGSLAGSGEILTSSTVKDLVTGSGIEFADRGEHALKGVPGVWRVFAVVS
jgi:class 3 adenylate cyclase